MVIKKLSPGMVVYDVRRSTGKQVFNGKWQTWEVRIIEVNSENEQVFASWNSNAPRWYRKASWSKWRSKRPEG